MQSLLDQDLSDPLSSSAPNSASLVLALFDRMTLRHNEFTLYQAGLPSFPRAFTRDLLISAFLMRNSKMLYDGLCFAAHMQGVKKDPRTGEQPGAIFHEYDIELRGGVELRGNPGFTTFYAASDTTALFLLGHKGYFDLTGDTTLAAKQQKNIEAAASYIINHLNENAVFIEDPKFADAQKYALKVTSWKDSILFGRINGEPAYPVVYPLVHAQNMLALRAAARLTGSSVLMQFSQRMKEAILDLYDQEIGNFPLAIDREGWVKVVSTDGLHSLFYLEPADLDREKIIEIIDSSAVLETSHGYRVLEPKAAEEMEDKYHAETIWTHEQAQIHKGASAHYKFAVEAGDSQLAKKLMHVMDVSIRVNKFLRANPNKNPEIFSIGKNKITPGGNDPQLWAVAARHYFDYFLSTH